MWYSDILRWVSRILSFLWFIMMYKTWKPAHTVDPNFYTSCSPKGVRNTGFQELHIIINHLWKPIKESLKPTFISAHITWYPAEMLIYVTSCIFWANVKFRHWYFFLKPNHRKPAPSHVKISHDIQQKTSSTLHSTYFEPMVMFVIDTFLRNPITESLKPTFICWNITWHPAETSIYFIFRIFWANVNFCHWYFFFFFETQSKKAWNPLVSVGHCFAWQCTRHFFCCWWCKSDKPLARTNHFIPNVTLTKYNITYRLIEVCIWQPNITKDVWRDQGLILKHIKFPVAHCGLVFKYRALKMIGGFHIVWY